MSIAALRAVPAPQLTPLERALQANAERQRFAAKAALEAIDCAQAAVVLMRQLKALGDALPPAVQDGAPRLADHIANEAARFLASLNATGRIR